MLTCEECEWCSYEYYAENNLYPVCIHHDIAKLEIRYGQKYRWLFYGSSGYIQVPDWCPLRKDEENGKP